MEKTDALMLLAIDDKPDNLTTLSAVVQDALPRTRVLTATSGLAGIELAVVEDPDVILLDVVMPGMDGFEVCRRLKADKRIKDIPVLFLTALKTEAAIRVKALEAGCEGFLAKPLETVELIAQITAMTKVKAANRGRRTEKERLEVLVAERTQELAERIHELQRWHDVMLDREDRVIELKREVNELLARLEKPPRYPSAVAGDLNGMSGDSPPLRAEEE